MPVKQQIEQGRIPVKIYTDTIEPDALQQLVNVSRLPIVRGHIAAMPDVHLGKLRTSLASATAVIWAEGKRARTPCSPPTPG